MTLTWFRLLDYASGSIWVDGINIATIRRDILRSRIIFIAEEPFILPGSVRDNLDIFGEADDNAITDALRKTMLLDTVVAAGGLDVPMTSVPISQGQKQLLNFARALLRKRCKMIILDEATSRYVRSATTMIPNLQSTTG